MKLIAVLSEFVYGRRYEVFDSGYDMYYDGDNKQFGGGLVGLRSDKPMGYDLNYIMAVNGEDELVESNNGKNKLKHF